MDCVRLNQSSREHCGSSGIVFSDDVFELDLLVVLLLGILGISGLDPDILVSSNSVY